MISNLSAVTDFLVSVAGPADLDEFVASVTELFREDAGRHDPYMNLDWPAREGAAYYGGLLSDPSCLLALARCDGRGVGHLVGKLSEPSPLRRARFAILESIRVDPAVRGRGVGGLLVREFFGWAQARGAERASVTAFAANEAAQRFYRRHGFAAQTVSLRAVV
jgi:GNAT superfamily N-acetyltransferase